MINIIIPNLVPVIVTPITSITKLYSLIAIIQVVMAPLVVGIGIWSILDGCKKFLAGNGSNGFYIIRKVMADGVAMT